MARELDTSKDSKAETTLWVSSSVLTS